MMLRDNFKDEKYFTECLLKTERSIEKFENLLSEVLNKGENDRGIKNGYNILINNYTKEINLLYSKGEQINIIKEKYRRLLFFYSKMWYREYGYIELIRILSLAVLLDVKSQEISQLSDKIRIEKFDDYLVNYLISYINRDWDLNAEKFVFEGIYDELKTIIEDKNNSKSQLLDNYLSESWYFNHRDAAWFDSHKSKENVFCGYWSFEAGAVAKILKINDISLKNVQYYPYDLVHFENS